MGVDKTLKSKLNLNRPSKVRKSDKTPVSKIVTETKKDPPKESDVDVFRRELLEISKKAEMLRILEEQEKVLLKEEEDKSFQEKLTSPFTQNKNVDMKPAVEYAIEELLPKAQIPEVIEYPEPFQEEPALNRELAEFKRKINQHLHQVGFASSGGGGEVKLEFLDDVDASTAKVNSKFLKFDSSSGKFVGDDPSVSTLALTALDIDGGTDINAAIVDADLFIVDDGAGGTNRKTAASRIKTYVADVTLTTAAQTNITSVGALNGGSITSGFGTIDTGSSAITTTGAINGGSFVVADAGNIGSASDADALAIAANGVVNFTQTPTVASAAVKFAGKESIFIPAAAMYPSTTNGCAALAQVETTALRPDLKCLDFAPSSDEFAQFAVAFPKSWNEGTVTFQPFWTVTGTNTGTVAGQLGGIAVSSDDSIDTAFGTLVATNALAHSGTSNDLMVSAESGAVTIAGSPAAADQCFFQINRDVSADNQSGDARLLGIKLFFTTDAGNDA